MGLWGERRPDGGTTEKEDFFPELYLGGGNCMFPFLGYQYNVCFLQTSTPLLSVFWSVYLHIYISRYVSHFKP